MSPLLLLLPPVGTESRAAAVGAAASVLAGRLKNTSSNRTGCLSDGGNKNRSVTGRGTKVLK